MLNETKRFMMASSSLSLSKVIEGRPNFQFVYFFFSHSIELIVPELHSLFIKYVLCKKNKIKRRNCKSTSFMKILGEIYFIFMMNLSE